MKISQQALEFLEKHFDPIHECTLRDKSDGYLFYDGKGRLCGWSIELIEDLVKARGSKIPKGGAFFTPLIKGESKIKLYSYKAIES